MNLVLVGQSASLQIEVKDKKTKESIPFANIKVQSADGLLKNVTTDVDGKAFVSGLSTGTYLVGGVCVGYKSNVCNTEITSSKVKKICLEMEQESILLTECVIVANTVDYDIISCGGCCCRGSRCCCPWIYLKTDSVSVDENKKTNTVISNFKCYPNPTTGIIFAEPSPEIKELMVFDASGRAIQQYSLQGEQQQQQIDLTNCAPGIYFISYLDQGAFHSERVVVAR